jgi:hypothetical protein
MWHLVALALVAVQNPTPLQLPVPSVGAQVQEVPPPPPVVYQPVVEVTVQERGGIFTYRYKVHNPASSNMNVSRTHLIFYGVEEGEDTFVGSEHLNYLAQVDFVEAPPPRDDEDGCTYCGRDCDGNPGWVQRQLRLEDYVPEKFRGFLSPAHKAYDAFECNPYFDANIGKDHVFAVAGPNLPVVIKLAMPGDHFGFLDAYHEQLENLGIDSEMADEEGMLRVQDAAEVSSYVLGPLPFQPRSTRHWVRFLWSLDKGRELGWFPDQGLFASLRDKAQRAYEAALAQRGEEVRSLLVALEQQAQGAGEGQISSEGRMLAVYNARSLREELPFPCEPAMLVEKPPRQVPPHAQVTVRVRVYNQANGVGIPGEPVTMLLASDIPPEMLLDMSADIAAERTLEGFTDQDGWVSFPLPPRSGRAGDQVWYFRVRAGSELGLVQQKKVSAHLREKKQQLVPCGAWRKLYGGGEVWYELALVRTNLVVRELRLPYVLSGPGREVYLHDVTANVGKTPVGPTVTRYYISEQEAVDPGSAKVLGQRGVPALGPGEESNSGEQVFTVPEGLRPGKLWLFACADADGNVAEDLEDDNCSRGQTLVSRPLVAPAIGIEGRLPVGVVGQPYAGELRATGGWAPYRFRPVEGELPPGVSLGEDGQVRGVPTASGNFPVRGVCHRRAGVAGDGELHDPGERRAKRADTFGKRLGSLGPGGGDAAFGAFGFASFRAPVNAFEGSGEAGGSSGSSRAVPQKSGAVGPGGGALLAVLAVRIEPVEAALLAFDGYQACSPCSGHRSSMYSPRRPTCTIQSLPATVRCCSAAASVPSAPHGCGKVEAAAAARRYPGSWPGETAAGCRTPGPG